MKILSRIVPLAAPFLLLIGFSAPASAQVCIDTPLGKVCLKLLGGCDNHEPKCEHPMTPPQAPPPAVAPPVTGPSGDAERADVLAEKNLKEALRQLASEADTEVKRSLAAAVASIGESKKGQAGGGSGSGSDSGGSGSGGGSS